MTGIDDASGMSDITIAQLSDLHLGPLPPFGLRDANLKRALGAVNWLRKRRHIHRTDVFERMLAAIKAAVPDHIMVTGDLVNVGLPVEHASAALTLATIGAPETVSVVPGNHDIYCRLWRDKGVERWRAYMTGGAEDDVRRSAEQDEESPPRPRHGTIASIASAADDGTFPFVRRIGDVVLVGVNSAVPTPPGIAQGEVGPAQRERIKRLLTMIGKAGLFRLVMIHHPPLPGQAPWQRALRDADALKACLAEAGAELVVHGHNHRDSFETLATAAGETAIVGIGSASMVRAHRDEPAARAAIYRIGRDDDGWRVTLTRLGYQPETRSVATVEERVLRFARPSVADPQCN